MSVHVFMIEYSYSSDEFLLHYHYDGSEEEKVISISGVTARDLRAIDYSRRLDLFISLKDRYADVPDGLMVKAFYSVNMHRSSSSSFETVEEELCKELNRLISS